MKAIHKAIKDSGKPRNVVRGVAMGHSGVIDADKALGTILSSAGLTGGSTLYPAYMRGDAYLAAKPGPAAAAEFQKYSTTPGLFRMRS